MFDKLSGTSFARRHHDILISQELKAQHRVSEDVHLFLYTMLEARPDSSRFKLGLTGQLEVRTRALSARDAKVVRRFEDREVAFAVEQGLHATLYPFRHRRPALHGVHGGETEWYQIRAADYVTPLASFFDAHVRACKAVRDCPGIKPVGRASAVRP